MSNFDTFNLAVKTLAPTNEILLDDKGLPSVMVKIPKFTIGELLGTSDTTVHPAFKVNGEEKSCIYISKFQNIVVNDRAYSLPNVDPKAGLNYDQAKTYCENKGSGWHLMTNAEWAMIALWCKKNGTMPNGNNSYGAAAENALEKGIVSFSYLDGSTTKNGRVFTGSGPLAWSHNRQLDGIWDLNGNIWEWVSGYRLVDGEIQIFSDNNAAITGTNTSATSTLWKAVKPDGSLVTPGTSGTLKWDYLNSKIVLTTTNTVSEDGRNQTYESLTAADGVTVPTILKVLGIFPADSTSHGSDAFYMCNSGERVSFRGGYWYSTSAAGVFHCYLRNLRSFSDSNLGFRSAFIPQ